MGNYIIPTLPLSFDVETKAVLKQVAAAHRRLAELKGAIKSMPNASILINTLALQESKDSSEIESIITTHDELYKAQVSPTMFTSAAAKNDDVFSNSASKFVSARLCDKSIASIYVSPLISPSITT